MGFCEIVPDCRNDKNKVYSATELVFITTVAVLCGSDTWNEIQFFCERNFELSTLALLKFFRAVSMSSPFLASSSIITE